MQILCKLDHPNIVKYYESFQNDKFFYIVMEFCEGRQLFDKLTGEKNSSFTENEAKQIMI